MDWFANKRGPKKLVCLIDLENINRWATDEGQIIDLRKLRDMLLQIGDIIFAFIFVPDNYAFSETISEANNLGFDIILCQRVESSASDHKMEDTVDIRLIQAGEKFSNFDVITDIVICSGDGHMVHLATQAILRNKTITVLAPKNLSRVMVGVVGANKVVPFPLRRK